MSQEIIKKKAGRRIGLRAAKLQSTLIASRRDGWHVAYDCVERYTVQPC